ncbi:hypothetical protein Dsin_029466 [Dipteronia sinensis]|uniref:Uncharacterized protein n=1 Tax=Dipteronia sinensis TaxID=43782 RepID=A0AAD9ZT55_9ROSI|nr:hypothetical protein Dsin_029466 [Dipteronia sinensis]
MGTYVLKDEGINGNQSPSSSNMISFELSNGNPYGPHVPTTTNEDQFVEYQLDDLAGFPSNVEEEERMFMEAVIMSLKDLEMRHPEAEVQPTSATTGSLESSQKDNLNDSPTTENCKSVKTETSSISVERSVPQKAESTCISLANGPDFAYHPSPDSSMSSAGPPFDTPPSIIESASTATSSRSDSASLQSTSDADVSNNTKATLTIERNPSGHIMEGLMRRWDFGFFRNNR